MKNRLTKIALFLAALLSASPALAAFPTFTSQAIRDRTIVDNDIANGTIQSLQISDNTVAPGDIRHFDTPTDEECLTYESTGNQVEYQSCGGNPTLDDVYNNSASGNKTITVDDGAVTLNASGTNKGLVVTQSGSGNQAEIGNVIVQSDNDLIVPQGIVANKVVGMAVNLTVVSATTTNSDDSVKVTCGAAACSATNPGYAIFKSATSGQMTTFTITSDVTIGLSGAHWGQNTRGNVTGGILDVVLDNDNDANLRTCVVWMPNRKTFLTTDTNATPANVDEANEVLCNTAVGSANNTVLPLAYVRADFNDTGDVWSIQGGAGDIIYGSSDGICRTWKQTFGGFTSDPTANTNGSTWCPQGELTRVIFSTGSNGTSNATSFTMSSPIRGRFTSRGLITEATSGGVTQTVPGMTTITAGSSTITLFTTVASGAWGGTLGKGADIDFVFKSGPAASWIE